MPTDKTYKKNFLTSVIARVDLVNPLENIKTQIPNEILKDIIGMFPIAEQLPRFSEHLTVSQKDFQRERTEFTEWRFSSNDRRKNLTVIPTAIIVEVKNYESYKILKSDFISVIDKFFNYYKDAIGNRLGLRYINEISLSDGDPFSWNDLLNSTMLSLFEFCENKEVVSRIFNIIEFNYSEYFIRYQFGVPNPDYPSPIIKKSFVLDFDAYVESELTTHDISDDLDKFHENIQKLFEKSITDKFRSIIDE
jgi:uncharacterized protein (TIGR04255 family)